MKVHEVTPGHGHGESALGTPPAEKRAIMTRLLLVALVGAVASLLIGFGLRALGHHALSVPTDFPTLGTKEIVPACVAPVIGNSFGFFMSFVVRPRSHSMLLFLLGALIFLVVSAVIIATKLPSWANAGSIAVSAAIVIIPNLIVPVLLVLVPRRPYR